MALTLEYLDSHVFGSLEPFEPAWLAKRDDWESYTQALFRANGLLWEPTSSNVDHWLQAPDRAPFLNMAGGMLPALQSGRDLSRVALVIVAHWTPDLHLGTSVSNYLLHELGLTKALGFAISERGLSAPLFAVDCAARYLQPGQQALVLVADQRHLLYRSPAFDPSAVSNSASLLLLEQGGPSRPLTGYRRQLRGQGESLADSLGLMLVQPPAWPVGGTLVADPATLAATGWTGLRRATDPARLCSAPFAALADCRGSALLLQADAQALYGLGVGAMSCV
jgi:hypothetical protein